MQSESGHLGHVTMAIYTNFHSPFLTMLHIHLKVGNDQEFVQSERNIPTQKSEVKKKQQKQSGTYTKKTYRKPSEQLFPNRRPLT